MSRDDNPWTRRFYPSGTPAFDRAVFFSDAVFAIALTLVAVEIGVPDLGADASAESLWRALLEKVPNLIAYAFTFFWVGFYWRANHRFTDALAGMSSRYLAALLVYLALVAMLPFPAATLGEYGLNPVALAFFSLFVAAVSTMETVLLIVADRGSLFRRALTPEQRRQAVLGSLTPVVAFLVSVPAAFASPWLALACWLLALPLGLLVQRRLAPATW